MGDDVTIQPGDVFIKRWGDRCLTHIMTKSTRRVAKQQYMRLESGRFESTWNTHRARYGNTSTKRRWHYVGTIPEPYLAELIERKTLR